MNTPFTVSNHSLGIILSCQRAGWLYKIKRRVKAVEEKPGADAGAALHAALARYYGEAVSMNVACEALADHQAGEDYRTPAYLSDCLRAYERHWGDDRATFKTIAVELPFSLHLTDDIVWEGRVDRVLEHPDGRLIIQDHKSSRDWGNLDLDRFERNPSLPGYVWAASKLLNRPIATTELNALVIRKPLVKERADAKSRFEFHRAQFLVEQERVDEWALNVKRVVTAFLRAVQTDTITTNENSCVSFGSRCQFYEYCSQPVNQRETMLATDMFTDYKSRVAVAAD